MKHVNITKQKLLSEIDQLSNPYILELQNFVQYLKFKQSRMASSSKNSNSLRPEDDPILQAFGIIDVAPFSETIDDTLYGAV